LSQVIQVPRCRSPRVFCSTCGACGASALETHESLRTRSKESSCQLPCASPSLITCWHLNHSWKARRLSRITVSLQTSSQGVLLILAGWTFLITARGWCGGSDNHLSLKCNPNGSSGSRPLVISSFFASSACIPSSKALMHFSETADAAHCLPIQMQIRRCVFTPRKCKTIQCATCDKANVI